MTNAVEHNLAELNRTLATYTQVRRAAGKAIDVVIPKKAAQLGFQLRAEFRTLMPEKGGVREERLAALKAGEGVRVRPVVYQKIAQKYNAVGLAAGKMLFRTKGKVVGGQEILGELKGSVNRKGKRMNLQALAVQRELNLRESGRGFMAQGAKFIGLGTLGQATKAMSKYNAWLGQAGIKKTGEGAEARFEWGGLSSMSDDVVKAIGRVRGQAAVARALSAITADMQPYIAAQLAKELKAAVTK
jgi:hypothetical protein